MRRIIWSVDIQCKIVALYVTHVHDDGFSVRDDLENGFHNDNLVPDENITLHELKIRDAIFGLRLNPVIHPVIHLHLALNTSFASLGTLAAGLDCRGRSCTTEHVEVAVRGSPCAGTRDFAVGKSRGLTQTDSTRIVRR